MCATCSTFRLLFCTDKNYMYVHHHHGIDPHDTFSRHFWHGYNFNTQRNCATVRILCTLLKFWSSTVPVFVPKYTVPYMKIWPSGFIFCNLSYRPKFYELVFLFLLWKQQILVVLVTLVLLFLLLEATWRTRKHMLISRFASVQTRWVLYSLYHTVGTTWAVLYYLYLYFITCILCEQDNNYGRSLYCTWFYLYCTICTCTVLLVLHVNKIISTVLCSFYRYCTLFLVQ